MMLTVALALVVVAATAAVVIRDAHPKRAKPVVSTPDATEAVAEPLVFDAPTEAMDIAQLHAAMEDDTDAPTQSMPMPVAFAGAQAAVALTYPSMPGPSTPLVAQPAAFVPAGTPYAQPDPDRLIQTEVVVPVGDEVRKAAFTKLVLGIAISGTALGLLSVAGARAIGFVFHVLVG
jgi:hypothetical protein